LRIYFKWKTIPFCEKWYRFPNYRVEAGSVKLIVALNLFLSDNFQMLLVGMQVSIANIGYDETPDVSRGLSDDSLRRLPCHVILEEIEAAQSISCRICLQVLLFCKDLDLAMVIHVCVLVVISSSDISMTDANFLLLIS
jgi:hypothetical protein